MSNVRKDAIGQEIKVGDIVMPFAKSGSNLQMSIVTRHNPRMIQLNGITNIEDDRLVVVTENLMLMGKQNVIDSFRKQYESKLNEKAKEAKIAHRYLVMGTPRAQNPQAWVVKFEGTTVQEARDVWRKWQSDQGIRPTHLLKKKQDGSLYWGSGGWYEIKNCILAWRSLPDVVAQCAGAVGDLVEVVQPDYIKDLEIARY